ncbi:MAG: hypothetical protein IT572_09955 [Deltaproteobacteria bacterium]|nr:hypothetical protein [Deltaproteobacteria bacterium]
MPSSTAIAKTPMVLALRDSLNGKEVVVPHDAKGKPDFFVAGLELRRLQEPKAKPAADPAADKTLQAARENLKNSKKEYAKAAKEYNAALTGYEKARDAAVKAREDKAKPGAIAKLEAAAAKAKEKYQNADALLCAYRKGYEHDRGVYEKLAKSRHRAPAYDYATGSYRAFGKKFPKACGAPLLVAIPAPAKALNEKTSGKVAASKPAKPAVKTAPIAPKPFLAVPKKLPPSPPKVAPKTASPVGAAPEVPKISVPKTPSAPKHAIGAAKPETPAVSAGSEPTNFTGVSDAEAANYTVPVEGYPTAKAPVYLWKHKSQDEFLAVFEGKRLKLNKAQFLSLDKGAHPEFYAKAGKPLPKMPPPKKTSDPDF